MMNKKYIIGLMGVTTVMLILHLVFRITTWQVYPLYMAIVVIVGIMVYSIVKPDLYQSKKRIRIILFTVYGILIVTLAFSEYAFPIYEIPLPTGDFSIGTESFVLTDTSRLEEYGDADNRKIKIQVWYPAETTEGYELVPWLEDGKVVAQALAKDTGLPSFVLNHTETIMSNSYKEAPLSDTYDDSPVVVISHGWRGFRNLHTDLAEELASIGYIVVGIDHTHGSVATVFNDEDISFLNLEALPDRDTNSNFLEDANTLVNTYAGDITFTLDELEKMNTGILSSRFENKLDLVLRVWIELDLLKELPELQEEVEQTVGS